MLCYKTKHPSSAKFKGAAVLMTLQQQRQQQQQALTSPINAFSKPGFVL
jgi:hypothetical protein